MSMTTEQIIAEIDRFKLDVPAGFNKLTNEQKKEAYNGIGADWQSKVSRKILTIYYNELQPAAMIHDDEATYFNDGSEAGFLAWNKRIYRNCKKIVLSAYGWYNPILYIRLFQSRIIYNALRLLGWSAWIEAYNNPDNIAMRQIINASESLAD